MHIPVVVCSISVRLACILSDYRGLQELTGMKGSPSHFSCFKCWISGFLTGKGKQLFTNHYTCLPLDHPMPSTNFGLYETHNFSGQTRVGKEKPWLFRSLIELILNKELPFTNATVLGEHCCTRDGEMTQSMLVCALASYPSPYFSLNADVTSISPCPLIDVME